MRPREVSPLVTGTLAAIAAGCLSLSACTPGAASAPAVHNAPVAGVVTNPARLGHITLHVLDYFTGGVDNTWMKDVIAGFEKKYPNITVQRSSLTWTDLMQELPLKLKSASPPDLVPPNNRWQWLATRARGGRGAD